MQSSPIGGGQVIGGQPPSKQPNGLPSQSKQQTVPSEQTSNPHSIGGGQKMSGHAPVAQ
jgi:hypothetical protein